MERKFKVLLTRRLHEFALNELRKRCEVTVHKGKFQCQKEEC